MDTKYVISVDALDLSLLPITYQPRRNTPFWDHNDDLSEFTIHINDTPADQRPIEDSRPQTKAVETTMCHMCKVDVPKQFFKEHKKSQKHNAYTKIANIALQRIKEHISDGCDCDETEVDTSNYFCTHCVAAVNINERKSHEKSHGHKNSVFLDRCLSEFLNLYTTFDKTDDDEDSNVLNVTKPNVKEDNKFDLKNYLNILKDKYKMSMTFTVINEDRLEIEVGGSRVEVAVQNFLGFKTKTNDSLECVVCKEVVKVIDKVEHMMSAKHMFRVSTPFKDVHCKREIYPLWQHCVLCNVIIDNYNIHTKSDPSHLRLLQEALKVPDQSKDNSISSENWTLVTNKTNKTETSTNQNSSENKYSDLVDTDNNSTTGKDESAANKSFCSHCNVFIVTKNLKKHLSTKKHLCNTISPFYYLFQIDLDVTTCRICDIVVNVDDFEKHVNLSKHTNKYNVLLSTNKIRKIDKNHLFCDACDKVVFVRNELYHMKGNDHMQYLESNTNTSPTTSYYHCNICDVQISNTDLDIKLHSESVSHNLNKLTKPIASESPVSGNNYFYNYTMLETQSPGLVNCSVCDVLVPRDEVFIQKHIDNENHIKKYEKLLQDHQLVLQNDDDIHCNICKVFVGFKSEIMHLRGKRHLKNLKKIVENSTISAEENATLEAREKVKASGVNMSDAELKVIYEHYDISDSLKELVCKICKVTVPFTVFNSSGHLGGSKHKQKLRDMEIENFVTTNNSVIDLES